MKGESREIRVGVVTHHEPPHDEKGNWGVRFCDKVCGIELGAHKLKSNKSTTNEFTNVQVARRQVT